MRAQSQTAYHKLKQTKLQNTWCCRILGRRCVCRLGNATVVAWRGCVSSQRFVATCFSTVRQGNIVIVMVMVSKRTKHAQRLRSLTNPGLFLSVCIGFRMLWCTSRQVEKRARDGASYVRGRQLLSNNATITTQQRNHATITNNNYTRVYVIGFHHSGTSLLQHMCLREAGYATNTRFAERWPSEADNSIPVVKHPTNDRSAVRRAVEEYKKQGDMLLVFIHRDNPNTIW